MNKAAFIFVILASIAVIFTSIDTITTNHRPVAASSSDQPAPAVAIPSIPPPSVPVSLTSPEFATQLAAARAEVALRTDNTPYTPPWSQPVITSAPAPHVPYKRVFVTERHPKCKTCVGGVCISQ